jgi:dTDP-4-dehydrorhamnose 3,5-epimerase
VGSIKLLDGVNITPLKIIENVKGNILRGLRSDENSYNGFGEAYFSKIKHNTIKGWKLHKEMTMNLIVPIGKVKFVFFDEREKSKTNGKFFEYILSKEKYSRLTISPNIWFGFMGLDEGESLVLNLSNIIHNDNEIETKMIEEINYDWKKKTRKN